MITSRWKRQIAERIEISNQENITEKENYTYLGILKAVTIKKVDIYIKKTNKQKNKTMKSKYLRITKNLIGSKLYSRNIIKRIKISAVFIVRYSEFFHTSWSLSLGQMNRLGYCQKKKKKKKITCRKVNCPTQADCSTQADYRVKLKEREKSVKFLDFVRELNKRLKMKVTVILIVLGTLETIPKGFVKGLQYLEIKEYLENIWSARILKRPL